MITRIKKQINFYYPWKKNLKFFPSYLKKKVILPWKKVCKVGTLNFFFKQVFLIQKQNYVSVFEPFAWNYFFEKALGFFQSISLQIFHQHLNIFFSENTNWQKNTWSNSETATRKMIAVTDSKTWTHFLRSPLCPVKEKLMAICDYI